MDEILKNIPTDLTQLRRYIVGKAAAELSALSTPCYYPKTKKFPYDILHVLKITEKDFKEFIKRNNKGTKAEKWLLPNDLGTVLLIFVMYLFLKKKDRAAYSATIIYFLIVQYSRLMHKQIKYCYEDTFKYTLDNLTRTHLFSREKTIPNSLFYLSNALQSSFTKDIASWDKERIFIFMSEARSRISQSIKSFAESYYKNRKEGIAIKTQSEETEDNDTNIYQYKVLQRGQRVVDEVTKKITIYKTVDKKAFEDAKQISKAKTSISTLICNEVANEKYFNQVKILLQLFVKGLTDVKMVCGNEYYDYIKKLMALKRTTAQIYFKAQVNILLQEILKNLKLLEVYKKYTSQTQFIISSFLAFYITSIFRNTICST
jgi:hypothetical protein